MGPKPVSFPEEDRAILNKVNSLLSQLHVDRQVGSVEEIGAGVFVTLFEGLCGEQLTGIVRSADTREDEVHNCQVVIDSLAGDVLHTSLTHIAGADIIDGSREAISNLLEIFSGLLEYMLNKIDSDISTDNDEDDQNLTTDDPDRITRDEIDDILDMELRRERLMHEAVAVKNGGPTVAWEEEPSPNKKHAEQGKTQDVQKQGKPQEKQKSTKPQEPQKSGKPQGIEKPQTKTDEGETTADLIKESEEIERRLAETRQIIRDNEALERRLAETRARATQASMGPTETDSPLVEPRETLEPRSGGDSTLDRQRETRADIIRRLENDPRYKYMLPPTQSQTQAADEQTDETFRTLQSMVEETAAMARAAVKCNPQEARSLLQSMETNKRLPERSRRERQFEGSRSRTAKRASPSARHASPKSAERLSDNELTPSKAKRKVSFLMERSLTDTSTDLSRSSPTRRSYHESSSENTSYQDRLRKQYEGIVTSLLSDDDSLDRQKAAARSSRYKELARRPHALYTLGQTQQVVSQEKEVAQKKMGFLQKIYREDLDELTDEADYLLARNRENAREKEKEFQKKMLSGLKTKPLKERQGPAVLKKKVRASNPHVVGSKVKKSSVSGSIVRPVKKIPLTIHDDEDLLPVLLDEFPHLHLSLHTWHELWRKGLTQIEQITRAYQEVRRKKSLAQNQLEEAEQRQEIMVNIVKKELQHEQRLKDVKDRRATAITTRNKIHERRMQSARSRHYYDEYQVRMRAKMLKRRTKEEMLFKKLFQDSLEIQKERLHELRKYAREHRDSEARVQRDQIESMENYYRDQFQMLAENLSQEKEELAVRERAQKKVLDSMKKDLRKKMETEIQTLQQQLVRDDDDVYFRQLDADRVIRDLKVAKYQVRI